MSRLPALAAACGVLVLVAAPAGAQDWPRQPATINVTGTAHVEGAPDRFSISASINGRGADQVSALRAMADAQTRVTDGVTRLRGLTWSEFSTGNPVVQPVYSEECQNRGYGRQDGCDPIGYVVTQTLSLEGAPAERAGDAVSLAAERGARDARLTGYSLSDDSGLRRDAARAAFADARRQADVLADASGQRIVRVVSVNRPSVEREAAYNPTPVAMAISGAQNFESPTVALTVTPAPIKVESSLMVEFEVE